MPAVATVDNAGMARVRPDTLVTRVHTNVELMRLARTATAAVDSVRTTRSVTTSTASAPKAVPLGGPNPRVMRSVLEGFSGTTAAMSAGTASTTTTAITKPVSALQDAPLATKAALVNVRYRRRCIQDQTVVSLVTG
ncbi:hypothetical protein C0Q70_15781 [Pomacea canaliculata]|uniref:Uncharacterized protein n=1 Tax=Pomacea canaliculata TaxID=400727 RepID=A0A2T7NVT3_POMCA|nr:hypothetical protein C0Q70_15781 [Pomacea canaliculata]